MSEIRNAVIRSTMLGVEDHGIFTAYLELDYGGTMQGFGGWSLDGYHPELKRRIGTAWGAEFIARVMATVGVTKWEGLPGKHIRADCDHGHVYRIGHIIEDRWFDPKNDLAFLLDRAKE